MRLRQDSKKWSGAKGSGSNTTESKPPPKTKTFDLRQEAQPPPDKVNDVTTDPGDENEVDDDDDEKKEPPEGKSRVIFPDGQVAFIPTPYAEQLARQRKGLRLLKQDVRPAGVGNNPYEKKIVLGRTGRRVIEITSEREIRS